MYEVNIAPDFALLADSADRRITWAVTADARGLSVIACSGSVVQTDLISGRMTSDNVDLAFTFLGSVTRAALGPGADARQQAQYSRELGALKGSLRRTLPILIRDAQRLHPGFLRKEPEMPRPPQF